MPCPRPHLGPGCASVNAKSVNAKPNKSAAPDPIDVEVGQRLRALRRVAGVTQAALADALCLSFQQVQKYERGLNRISASMLVKSARALGATVAHLVGEEPVERGHAAPGELSDRERSEFLLAFKAVPPDERRVLIRLMASIARPERAQDLTVRAVS